MTGLRPPRPLIASIGFGALKRSVRCRRDKSHARSDPDRSSRASDRSRRVTRSRRNDVGPAAAQTGLTVIAEIVAKPEHADEVREALTPFAATTKSEAGCLHYALYEDAEAPGRFFTFERWTGEAAREAHLTSPAMKAAMPKLAPLMAAPLAIHKLRTLSE